MSRLNDGLTMSYEYSLERAVARLRSTADRIELVGKARQIRNGVLDEARPNHMRAAMEVMDEIRGMNGDLMLSSLIRAAHDADTLWELPPAEPVFHGLDAI